MYLYLYMLFLLLFVIYLFYLNSIYHYIILIFTYHRTITTKLTKLVNSTKLMQEEQMLVVKKRSHETVCDLRARFPGLWISCTGRCWCRSGWRAGPLRSWPASPWKSCWHSFYRSPTSWGSFLVWRPVRSHDSTGRSSGPDTHSTSASWCSLLHRDTTSVSPQSQGNQAVFAQRMCVLYLDRCECRSRRSGRSVWPPPLSSWQINGEIDTLQKHVMKGMELNTDGDRLTLEEGGCWRWSVVWEEPTPNSLALGCVTCKCLRVRRRQVRWEENLVLVAALKQNKKHAKISRSLDIISYNQNLRQNTTGFFMHL